MATVTEPELTVSQAGKRGGLTLLRKRGREFYVEIGRLGQQAMRKKYPSKAAEWGRRGGRPRKAKLEDMGEQGNS